FLSSPPPPTSSLFPYTTLFRSVVVLPAPLRPTRQTSSPAATDRLMPLRIRLPSMSTLRSDSSSIEASFQDLRPRPDDGRDHRRIDRKSTRLNSSHSQISYAVFC